MKLELTRVALRDTYTVGKLYIDGVYFCDTLEDKVRDINKNGVFDNGETKINGRTAIPYGKYEVVWAYSPRLKRYTPRLLNVKSFAGVLIHAGNTHEDTDGCILLGQNKIAGRVINSKEFVNKLYPIIKNACQKGKVEIEIK